MRKLPDIASWRVAVCGTQNNTLCVALQEALAVYGCEVVTVTEDDFRLPPPDLAAKMRGSRAVFNLCGDPYVAKWKGRYEFDIYRSRLEAIRSIGLAIQYCTPRPEVFISVSNAMVYDQFEVHDEFSVDYGDSLMAEVGQMETTEYKKLMTKLSDVRLVLVRMGYLMSDRGGAYPLIETLAKMGWGGCVNDGYQCIPIVHVDDAIEALLRWASDRSSSGIFNLSIPEMASMNELVRAFAKALGKHQHKLPKFIIKYLAGRAFRLLEQNCKVVPQRLISEGFTFKFPTVESIVVDFHRKDVLDDEDD